MQLSQIQVIPDVSDYDIVTPIELNAVGNYDGVVGEIYLRGFEIDREIEGDNIDLDYFVYDSNGGRDEFGDPIDPKNGRAATYYDPSFDSYFISIEDYVRLTPDPLDGSMDATVQIQYANQVSAPLLVTISIPVGEGQELPVTDTQITHEKTIHNRGTSTPRQDTSGAETDDRERQPVSSIDYGGFTVDVDEPSIQDEVDEPSIEEEVVEPVESTATTEEEYLGVSPTDQVIDNILDSTEDLDIKVVVPKEEVKDTAFEREITISTIVEEVNSLPTVLREDTITTVVEEVNALPTTDKESVIKKISEGVVTVPISSIEERKEVITTVVDEVKVPITEREDYITTIVNELDAVPITTVDKEEITKKIIEEVVTDPIFYTSERVEIITTIVEEIDAISPQERTETIVTVVEEIDARPSVRPILDTPVKEEVISGAESIKTLLNASTVEIFNETINKEGRSSKDLFTDYFGSVILKSEETLIRNTNFWGSELKNITAISPITEGVSSRNRTHGVAVTPRHVLISAHYTGQHPQQGAEMVFIDKENKVVKRTVVTTKSADLQSKEPDLAIVLLDSDLPSSIGFTRVMPSNIYNTIPSDELTFSSVADGYVYRLNNDSSESLIWSTNQTETSNIYKLNQLILSGPQSKNDYPVDSFTFSSNVGDKIDPSYNEGLLEKGDSSSPIFVNIGGEAVLIGIAARSNKGVLTGGRNIDFINSLIRDVDLENLDVSTNYNLTNINYNILQDDIVPSTDTPLDGINTGDVTLPGPDTIPGSVCLPGPDTIPGSVCLPGPDTVTPDPSQDDTVQDDPFISDKISDREEKDTTYTLTIVNNGPQDLIFVSSETQGFQKFAVGDTVKMEKNENSFSFVLSRLENIKDLTFTYSQVDLIEQKKNIVNGVLGNIFQSVAISSGYNVGTIQVYQEVVPIPVTPDPVTSDSSTDDKTDTDDRDYEDIVNDDFGVDITDSDKSSGGTVDIISDGPGPITINIDDDGNITYPEDPVTPSGGCRIGGPIIPSGGCRPGDPTTTTVDDPFDPPPTFNPPPTYIPPPPPPPIIPFIPANCGKIPVIRIGVPPREDPDNPDPDVPIVQPPPPVELLYPAPVLGLQIPFLSNINFDTNVTLATPPPLGLVDEEVEQQEVEQVQVSASDKINLCDDEEECNTLGF